MRNIFEDRENCFRVYWKCKEEVNEGGFVLGRVGVVRDLEGSFWYRLFFFWLLCIILCMYEYMCGGFCLDIF